MSSKNITKQLKALVDDFTDSQGNILEHPKGRFVRKKLDERRIMFLRRFVDLLLNTGFVSEETKLYIKDRYITQEGVAEAMRERGKEANPNSVSAKIWYDKNKIVHLFGTRFLVEITEYDNVNMEDYEIKLDKAFAKYCNNKALKDIIIDLPTGRYERKLENEEFIQLLEKLKPYIKNNAKKVSESITSGEVGYIEFLLSSNILDSSELKHRRILEVFLKTGEIGL